MSQLFGATAIAYGLFMMVAACVYTFPRFGWAQADNFLPLTFIVAGLFFCPFVIAVTRLGSNTPDGGETPPETKARLEQLGRACPVWKVIWYGFLAVVLFAWFIAPLLKFKIHPFYVFSGAISLLSGCWFLLVHPTARALFASDDRGAQLLSPIVPHRDRRS